VACRFWEVLGADRDSLLAEGARVLLLDPGPYALRVENVFDVAWHLAHHRRALESLLADSALEANDVQRILHVAIVTRRFLPWGWHEVGLGVVHAAIVEQRVHIGVICLRIGLIIDWGRLCRVMVSGSASDVEHALALTIIGKIALVPSHR